MRIAIPLQKDKVALQFAGASNFKFYEVDQNIISRSYTISSGVTAIADTAAFLKMAGVQMVICGGIGGAAIKELDAKGILIMGGIIGDADQRMQEFVSGTLDFKPIDPKAHHCHEHGEDHDHDCDGNCEGCSNECEDHTAKEGEISH